MKTMRTTNGGLLVGSLLLLVGFVALVQFDWAWWALFLCGLVAWAVTFKKDSLQAVTFPKKLWMIPVGALLYVVLSILIGLIASSTGLEWAANPASGHLGQIAFMLPFMLMGEELLGIGILEGARSKGLSMWTSTLLSAVVFGLIHIPSYWDGSLVSTLLHVLLLQGVARLIFNYVYIKTGRSIFGSWISHMIVDFVVLSIF
ncbi:MULTISPECIES: CPBP family intramembrane glutamic endopeptidase [Exiguobacterium]|uniref:CPBP family intramembrane glutamic endopeptidase n=1 Tax=Exiguobacterium TaxID=33986 RepID=UPI001EE20A57|nr:MULTISPECIES: CPBP family intramembrane glutamic endopeptidase [Exiguobacterium]UKS56373.1 CPBP family intramembrane metalloprotease [Exiguobacterium acetylicum]